jgi:uncharacterized protein (TIGR02145 family)
MRYLPLLIFYLFLFVAIPSCKKKGCTDDAALNYDPKAKSNDGSCKYSSTCSNGVQDGDETGVDCGGSCTACSTPTNANNECLNPDLNYGSVTDIDGNTYATIVIGTQTWMAENLRTGTYANGDPIPNVSDPLEWAYNDIGAWCNYDNDNQYDIPFGRLYNFYAIKDSRNICPTGWHVPTDAEWIVLIKHLDPNAVGADSNIAGEKMKSVGCYSLLPNASNESGLSAVPGGYRTSDNGVFGNKGLYGEYWTSTENTIFDSYYIQLYYNLRGVGMGGRYKSEGLSCRCIKD